MKGWNLPIRFLLYCNAALSGACLSQLKILVGHLLLPLRGERPVERIPFWAVRVRFMSFGLSPFHACALRLVSAFRGSQQLPGQES